jgi:ABC-2 type transport system permease protein
MDLWFWPMIDLLVWGFVTVYMLKVSKTVPALITFFIAAAILWNVLYRAQQVVSVSFLDDVWSRNILNIFAAPIRTIEYIGATYITGLAQALIVLLLMSAVAMFIYSFNLFAFGWNCALLFVNLLIMGWSLGLLTTGFVLRWGPPAEGLAWAIPFAIQPVSAVFYPVSILPPWLQHVAWFVPSSHVFEGMRQMIIHGHVDAQHILWAFALNGIYMIICALIFHALFEGARERGLLAKYVS